MKRADKVLVGITIQENSRRLIMEGHELAQKLGAPLHILHIRKGDTIFDNPESSQLLAELFAYGGQLGGEVHFLCSEHVSLTFSDFVKRNHFTHLVIGQSAGDLPVNSPSVYDRLTDELTEVEIVSISRN